MAEHRVPGALLAHYHPLARGPRVCLRLARRRDLPGIAELYARERMPVDQLALARLVGFELLSQLVLCATALVDSREMVLGVGAIELDRPGEPTLVVVDGERTDGLAGLLTDALVSHATALSQASAA
ncbi:MAG TPA: hypothetical protein VE571_08990 [Solirubrobacteraceae bacterium]|jgi:hypothetical protein|nr:hypothetical protein [Solirubrobacteraceae bacterium]